MRLKTFIFTFLFVIFLGRELKAQVIVDISTEIPKNAQVTLDKFLEQWLTYSDIEETMAFFDWEAVCKMGCSDCDDEALHQIKEEIRVLLSNYQGRLKSPRRGPLHNRSKKWRNGVRYQIYYIEDEHEEMAGRDKNYVYVRVMLDIASGIEFRIILYQRGERWVIADFMTGNKDMVSGR